MILISSLVFPEYNVQQYVNYMPFLHRSYRERKTSRTSSCESTLQLRAYCDDFGDPLSFKLASSLLLKEFSCWISFFVFNGRLCWSYFPSAKLFAENAFKNHPSLVELGRNNLAFLSERGILGIGS